MTARIDEIDPDVFRVCVYVPERVAQKTQPLAKVRLTRVEGEHNVFGDENCSRCDANGGAVLRGCLRINPNCRRQAASYGTVRCAPTFRGLASGDRVGMAAP